VDAETGRIEAVELTTKDADDASRVGPLLDQVDGPIASLTGDGAYDQEWVYGAVAARHAEAAVVVPPRKDAVPSEAAATAPTRRDRHLRLIAERGRLGWQTASGYNRRALAEAAVSRYKRVIGGTLRSRTDPGRATEVAIAARALNRMLELGRPESVRVG
jgi:Transposase DDE domain